MAQKTVILPEIGEITLTKRRGNTNIRLSYARDGSVRVSLPYFVPYQAGVQFVKSKTEWLQKHRPDTVATLYSGMRIGKAHRLHFVQRAGSEGCRVKMGQNTVTVSYPPTSGISDIGVQEAARRGALKALKSEADQLLPQRTLQLAKTYGFAYSSIATKRLSARWGSCSQFKDITLNTYLMQVPWGLIDYVILHELTHTEHLNHSPGFWQRLEQALPDAKKRRKELKNYRTDIPAQ